MDLTVELVARVFVGQFAVMNVAPVLPLLLAQARAAEEHSGVLLRAASTTAIGAGVGLVLLGPMVLGGLGITVHDLRVAGGVILLVFATYDLLFSRRSRKVGKAVRATPDMGVVPLGVPTLFGPASMTVLLVQAQAYDSLLVLAVFLVNQLLNGALLAVGDRLAKHLGAVAEVAGKVMAVILAALAVSMLRVGVEGMLAGAS